MWAYMNTDELYHYGVLGMKWGVRRGGKSKSSGKSSRKKSVDTRSDDAKEVSKISKKKVSEMSNAELRKYNDRKNLESQYSKLNPSKIKKGLAIAATTAAALGTVVSLYNNSNQAISIGKKIAEKMIK